MERSIRNPVRRLLGVAFIIAPFAFATIRILQTHNDFRMLWMAIAATMGAAFAVFLGTRRGLPRRRFPLAALALVVATALATITGVLLGALAVIGVFLVALVLSFFSVIGWLLAQT